MALLSGMNRKYTNGDCHSSTATAGLKVIIVGGGIGGFTAAIAFRQQGHDVELYEQSRFANEIGAAIHMVPNAVGLLRRLGVHVEEKGAVLLEQTRLVQQSGELIATINNLEAAGRWQNPWFLAHRGHLHKHLKEVATSPDGKGRPVQVHTSSKVVKVDPHTATVVLQDGTQVHGDLIVGADGVHSVARAALTEKEFLPFKSHHSAMRFLITKESALADPVTREWATPNGSMDLWYGPNLKVVLYPCVNNTLFNFVCIHDAALSDTSDDYNHRGSKDKLLEIYRDFEPKVLHLLDKVDANTLKVYPLFDMDALPTFVNDRLALIGDAAHPFTPHLAQGGAMAIEDAVSLAIMLPLGTKPDEISERLQLYNQARYERATTTQNNSRLVGTGALNLHDCMDQGVSHDEYHASTQLLRQYQWEQDRNLHWRQPTVFGPMPGPRQDLHGDPQLSSSSSESFSSSSSSITATIKFKTSATLLRTLFPNPSYSFNKADTVAQASFSVETLQNLAWLGGGSYDRLSFYIHNVQYTTRSGETLHGSYCPIMFANLTDSILSDREELGLPTLYSDISITPPRDKDDDGGGGIASDDVEVRIAWRGAEWATFRWRGLRERNGDPAEQQQRQPSSSTGISGRQNGNHHDDDGNDDGKDNDNDSDQQGIFVHKYIPASDATEKGAKRSADADYDVFIPNTLNSTGGARTKTQTKRVRQAQHADFTFQDLGFKKLPTLHHIVSRLAEMPVFEVVEASIVETEGEGGVLAGAVARRIE